MKTLVKIDGKVEIKDITNEEILERMKFNNIQEILERNF